MKREAKGWVAAYIIMVIIGSVLMIQGFNTISHYSWWEITTSPRLWWAYWSCPECLWATVIGWGYNLALYIRFKSLK